MLRLFCPQARLTDCVSGLRCTESNEGVVDAAAGSQSSKSTHQRDTTQNTQGGRRNKKLGLKAP